MNIWSSNAAQFINKVLLTFEDYELYWMCWNNNMNQLVEELQI